MKAFNVLTICVIFALLVLSADGKPIFDLLFGALGNSGARGRSQSSGSRQPRRGEETEGQREYKRICRVVNPDPYAFPGSVPFPAAPFCPY